MQATFPSHKTSCKMRKATHISSFLFNCQLSTTLECSGVALFESSLTPSASTKASHVSTSSSTGPGGKVGCRRESTSTSGFHLWYNHASSSAAMHPRIGHSTMVRQKPGSPSPQLKGPHQSVGVHGGDEQKSVKRGGNGRKWVNIQKCHIPNAEETSKPRLGATMMPLISQSMGLQCG